MERDVSKKTVIILLVLTIIVSVLGMWTVMERLSLSQQLDEDLSGSGTGQVRLTILPAENSEQTPPGGT